MAYSSGGQRGWLAQDRVGDADLADVMEEAGEVERPTQFGLDTQLVRKEEAVASDVIGVALGVPVLGVDRDHEALEHVEAAAFDAASLEFGILGQTDVVAPAGLGLAESDRGGREKLGGRGAVAREARQPRADGQRQPFRDTELQAQIDETRAKPVDGRLEIMSAIGRSNGQELVRSEAAQDRCLRELGAQDRRHLAQRTIPGGMPVTCR